MFLRPFPRAGVIQDGLPTGDHSMAIGRPSSGLEPTTHEDGSRRVIPAHVLTNIEHVYYVI